MIDIYSIRESEGEKIIQKNEETDKDGDCGERRKYKIMFRGLVGRRGRPGEPTHARYTVKATRMRSVAGSTWEASRQLRGKN